MMTLQNTLTNAQWMRDIQSFLRWWRDGLRRCLPPALRRRFPGLRLRYELEQEGEDFVVIRRTLSGSDGAAAENGREIGRWPVGESPPRGVRKLIAKVPLTLRLADARVLQRVLALPLVVEEDLGAMLELGLDRYVPFNAGQVYYDYRVEARDRSSGKLRLRLAVVPRAIVDPLLAALDRAGIQPVKMAPASAVQEFNLLPKERRPRRSKSSRIWTLSLVLGLVGLSLAILVIPLWQQRVVVVELLRQVNDARTKAERVSALRNELDEVYAASRFLVQKKQATPAAIDVLLELTRSLPDGTWLRQMELKDGKVQIRGESSDATALIGLLDASPWFTDPVFRSPVTRDVSSKQERFFLEARVVRPASATESAS